MSASEEFSLFIKVISIRISILRVEGTALGCYVSAINRNANTTSHLQNKTMHNGIWPK